MNLLISLRSEILKTKRTASLYLTIIAAAFGPLMSMLDLILDGVETKERNMILESMFTSKFQMTAVALFPFFLMLICTLLPQIEYKNNAWKQVLASPQTKGQVFLAKFINIQLLVVVFLVANQLLMFVDAVILHFMEPSLHVLSQSVNVLNVLNMLASTYVTLLALCAIQFWLGLRFNNFIAPVAIGFACWFGGTLLAMQLKSDIALYFPYSFHVYTSFPQFKSQLPTVMWQSLAYAALFLVLGFLDFRRRRMVS